MFFVLKTKAYALYSIPLIAPSWVAMANLEELIAFPVSIIGTMIVLHFIISDDAKENHAGLRMLVMRRRHFDAWWKSNGKAAP
jgi:hypothetical protein